MRKINKILWSKSVWFFDVDDTLVDTAKNSIIASEGVREVLKANFNPEVSENVQDKFNDMYNLLYQGYKVKKIKDWNKVPGGKKAYDELNARIADCQKDVVAKYGTYKKWSREIFLKLTADDLGIKISPELVHEAVDAYWMNLARFSEPFPGVLELVNIIKDHGRPIYLITSSDARLKMREDGQFEYIPEYSETLKRERVVILKDKGINFDGLSIGDPEDKPHLDFFEKGIKIAEENLGISIDLKYAIMIGDSFAGDLQTPKEKMDFGLVVLFQKDKLNTEIIDEHQVITGKLSDVAKFLN